MKRKVQESGFTIVEGLIIVVIVVSIAGIGFLVFRRQSSSNQANAEADKAFQQYVDQTEQRSWR